MSRIPPVKDSIYDIEDDHILCVARLQSIQVLLNGLLSKASKITTVSERTKLRTKLLNIDQVEANNYIRRIKQEEKVPLFMMMGKKINCYKSDVNSFLERQETTNKTLVDNIRKTIDQLLHTDHIDKEDDVYAFVALYEEGIKSQLLKKYERIFQNIGEGNEWENWEWSYPGVDKASSATNAAAAADGRRSQSMPQTHLASLLTGTKSKPANLTKSVTMDLVRMEQVMTTLKEFYKKDHSKTTLDECVEYMNKLGKIFGGDDAGKVQFNIISLLKSLGEGTATYYWEFVEGQMKKMKMIAGNTELFDRLVISIIPPPTIPPPTIPPPTAPESVIRSEYYRLCIMILRHLLSLPENKPLLTQVSNKACIVKISVDAVNYFVVTVVRYIDEKGEFKENEVKIKYGAGSTEKMIDIYMENGNVFRSSENIRRALQGRDNDKIKIKRDLTTIPSSDKMYFLLPLSPIQKGGRRSCKRKKTITRKQRRKKRSIRS